MKSTQKFLCYSLALVGAALMFSVGCKKADNVTNTTIIASQNPSLNSGGLSATGGTGALSATATAYDVVANMGSSSLTVVGFNYVVSALSWTTGAAVTPTYTGTLTMTGPAAGTGAFSTTLTVPATAFASGGALSGTVFDGTGDLSWKIGSFATNATGTAYSAVFVTVNSGN